ncbi:MAG: FkbM family methyltransferase [Candidatus Micrarchaeales archaeon]
MNVTFYDLLLMPINSIRALSSMFIKPEGYEDIVVNGNTAEYNYKGKLVRLSSDAVTPTQLKNIINEIFVLQPYRNLDVKGKVVVDIGASIGDTAIYFALNGAKHVYAVEPGNSDRFGWISKNIRGNGVADKITILKGRYNQTSLAHIIKKYGLGNGLVLKMDCEGGEYGILKEKPNTLKRFSHIDIEYHYGYRNLVGYLSKFFKINYTRPFYFPRHKMCVGYIRATKLGS